MHELSEHEFTKQDDQFTGTRLSMHGSQRAGSDMEQKKAH